MAVISQQHSYPLAELARIRTSGRRTIQAIHENQCPSLIQLADCTCEKVIYGLVIMWKAGVTK